MNRRPGGGAPLPSEKILLSEGGSVAKWWHFFIFLSSAFGSHFRGRKLHNSFYEIKDGEIYFETGAKSYEKFNSPST